MAKVIFSTFLAALVACTLIQALALRKADIRGYKQFLGEGPPY